MPSYFNATSKTLFFNLYINVNVANKNDLIEITRVETMIVDCFRFDFDLTLELSRSLSIVAKIKQGNAFDIGRWSKKLYCYCFFLIESKIELCFFIYVLATLLID